MTEDKVLDLVHLFLREVAVYLHYRTSLIGYWGKGSTVGWYGTWDSVLVSACCNNNGVSEVVT